MGVVYKITNKIDRKSYIGITTNSLEHRWEQHCSEAFDRGSSLYLHRAIRKYGAESFTVEPIEWISTWAHLCYAEQYWIKELKTFAPFGYNMTMGGDGMFGYHHTEETKQKLAELARNMPQEQRDRIAKSLRGRPSPKRGRHISEEQKQTLSKYRGPLSSRYGKKHTEETKQKMRNAALGNRSRLHKGIVFGEKEIQLVHKLHASGRSQTGLACRFGVSQSHISRVVNSKITH